MNPSGCARAIFLCTCIISWCGCTNNSPPGGSDAAIPIDAASSVDLAGCQPACGGLTPKCNAKNHCVGCLVDGDCPMGSYCKIVSDTTASCAPGCMADNNCANAQKCCGGRCVDVTSDPANCGGCAMACSGAHQRAACNASKCAAGTCDDGWADCNNDPKDGCEANLHADPMNCTGCGMACNIPNAYSGCADGCYAAACKFGYADCDNNAMNGCETKVSADPKNCGACGKACLLANAMAGCVSGNCVIQSCNLGFADCDGNSANGCESNVATDVNNCGKCGSVCPQGNVCKGGGCTCPMCNIPNASAQCVNNMCVFQACNPGFADCNKNVADGCEVNTNSDGKNCGGCGNVCPMNLPACNNGMCTNAFCHDIGYKTCPTGQTQFCDVNPISPTSQAQAQIACNTCYGMNCTLQMGDCAGPGYCFMDVQQNRQVCWGYQAGCSGAAGRVWPYGSSFTTYGNWAN